MMKHILLSFTAVVASLISAQAQFIQPHAGAVPRTNNSKMSEVISVEDFGASASASDNTTAINLAFSAASAGHRKLYFPDKYSVCSKITIPLGMTTGVIQGNGNHVSGLKACDTFSGTLMDADGGHSLITIQDFTLDANSLASTAVDLTRSPESSIQDALRNVRVINLPLSANGIVMDGVEDSVLDKVSINRVPGTITGRDISWHVIGGNINIVNSTMFGPLYLEYQNASIRASTIGPVVCDGVCWALSADAIYSYADKGAVKANFRVNSGYFGAITVTAGYLNPNGQDNVIAFQGAYSDAVTLIGSKFDPGSNTGYAITSSATTAQSGSAPSFNIIGSALFGSASVGTPAAGVYLNQLVAGRFTAATDIHIGANPFATVSGGDNVVTHPDGTIGILLDNSGNYFRSGQHCFQDATGAASFSCFGTAGTTQYGSSSGAVTTKTQAAAGTYNWNVPISPGTLGQPLLSGGGGSSPMAFGTLGVAAGGTGLVGGTSGGVPYYSGSAALTSSGVLASGSLVQGGGAGVAPSTFTLGGDCAFSTPNVTCTKTNGSSFGTAALKNTGTSGNNVPLLDGANAWSGAQTFSAGIVNTSAPATVVALNGNGSSFSVAGGGGTQTLPAFGGLLLVTNDTNGDFATYGLGGGTVALYNSTLGTWVASSSPSADHIGVYWTGSTYGIKNNFTPAVTVKVTFIGVRSGG